MALLVPVMVRGINNLSDARYCAGMGPTRLRFVLTRPSPTISRPKPCAS
ncbi:hypothetical protein MUN84_00340 [Hymenobacter sp. 5516J-16]|nr:hypothetical protein [Hymenobacter sp. 5516J-16]UOQ77229.1 hypothetical protein MUN84_00340 [Hymenobacter sp. 5516J-16]